MILIKLIHCVVIIIILYIPFSSNQYLLELYSILIPFIVLHWLLNNNICCLTLLESYLTGKEYSKTFIGRIIEPIYSINNTKIYIITFLLYGYALYQLKESPFKIFKRYLNQLYTIFKS